MDEKTRNKYLKIAGAILTAAIAIFAALGGELPGADPEEPAAEESPVAAPAEGPAETQ